MKCPTIALVCAVFASLGAVLFPANVDASDVTTETFSGIFFSNFENATFYACDDHCAVWAASEGYTLKCGAGVCDKLWQALPPANTTFNDTSYTYVVLTGVRSDHKDKPKYIGDPGQSITVEQIISVAPAKADGVH